MENSNALISTVAAAAADITYSNGTLTIAVDSGTFPSMYVPNIETFTKTTGVAETAQTNTVTYTPADSTTYELVITQNTGAANGAPTTFVASYTSDTSATDLEIATAFVDLINSQTDLKVTCTDAGGANTITLTADTGYPFFTASAISNMAVVAGATGVAAVGIGADLIAAGVAGAVSGDTYTVYEFDFYSNQPAQMGTETNAGLNTLTLYVNQGDADFAWFDGLLRQIVQPNSQDKYSEKVDHLATAAINATATATAAEVATGYITSTSAAGTTITLPTGTLLGAELGAVRGSVFDLFIDNTLGASTVTIAVAVNGILSTAAADSAGSFGDLTVASGVTGIACYRIMFASATAYVFTRIA